MQPLIKRAKEVENFFKHFEAQYSLETIKNMDYEMAIG
jgi:hypothetical protein